MKKIFLAFLVSVSAHAFELDRAALDNGGIAYIPHPNYVTYEVQFTPVKKVFEELKKTAGKIKNRGEAHITVITPPEFDEVLGKLITIEEINQLVVANKIQSATFSPVCVGMGVSGELRTYFIVVKSPDLINIRKKVRDLYVSRGGTTTSFDPEWFYPHITLGFTQRDLFESDGVIKDERSCLPDGEMVLR